MKATTVKRIFEELTEIADDCVNGIHMNIDGNGFSKHFVICDYTNWMVDTDENLLQLNIFRNNSDIERGINYIDTDSISRITIKM